MQEHNIEQFELAGIAGEYQGQRIPLSTKPLVLGKDHRKAGLVLSNPLISRSHCHIFVADGRVYIKDLESSNGTWINDEKRLIPLKVTMLESEDVISLAGAEVFQIRAVIPSAIEQEKKAPLPKSPEIRPEASRKPIPVQLIFFQPSDYAGFWKRFAAALIDGILITLIVYGLSFILGGALLAFLAAITDSTQPSADTVIGSIGLAMIGWFLLFSIGPIFYFSLMESSAKQATFGKVAMGIMVVDTKGQRISFGRAFLRNLGKIISGLSFCIGYIIAGFTEKKQALHDIMAGCLVINAQRKL